MIIYGKNLFLHLLKHRKDAFKEVYLAKECDKQLFSKIRSLNVDIKKVDSMKAQALARGGNHQGFLALVDDFVFSDINEIKKLNFVVVLHSLSDVGNIGAITRTAYALGAQAIIIISKSVNIEGVVRASSGAAFEIPICLYPDSMALINELKQVNFTLYLAQNGGINASEIKFANEKIALIMGSEGEGVPKKFANKCDHLVGIQMRKGWDSLNVSAAFAIICDRISNG